MPGNLGRFIPGGGTPGIGIPGITRGKRGIRGGTPGGMPAKGGPTAVPNTPGACSVPVVDDAAADVSSSEKQERTKLAERWH